MEDYRDLFNQLSEAYCRRGVSGLNEAGCRLVGDDKISFYNALSRVVNVHNSKKPSSRIMGYLPCELLPEVLAVMKSVKRNSQKRAMIPSPHNNLGD